MHVPTLMGVGVKTTFMKKLTAEKWNNWSNAVTKIIFYALAFYCFFPPTGVQFAIPRIFRIGYIVVIWVDFVAIVWKEKRIEKIFIPMVCYSVVLTLSTLINQADLQYAVWSQGLLVITLFILFKVGIHEDEKLFLKVFYYYCIAVLIADVITREIWKYPFMGYPRVDSTVLCNVDFVVCFCIPPLFTGIYLLEKFDHRKWETILYILVVIFCLLLELGMRCMGDFVTILVWTVLLLLARTKTARKLLNEKTAIAVPAGVGILTQCYNPETWTFIHPILNLMGKDATLSNRTPVWAEARRIIQEHIVLGTGDLTDYVSYFVETHHSHTHNIFMNALLKAGIIGFVFFAAMLVEIAIAISKITEGKLKYIAAAFLFCVLFNTQFDTYYAYYYYGFAGLLYFTSLSNLQEDDLKKRMLAVKEICV